MGSIALGLFLDLLILGLGISKVHALFAGEDLTYVEYVLGFPLLMLGIVLFYVDVNAFLDYIRDYN